MKKIILAAMVFVGLLASGQTVTHTSLPTKIDSDAIGTGTPPTQISGDSDFVLTVSGLTVGTKYRLFNQLRNASSTQFAGFARVPFEATSETMEFNITQLGWGFFGGGVIADDETASWFTQLDTDATPAVRISDTQSNFLVDDPDSTPGTGGDLGILSAEEEIEVLTPFTINYNVSGSLSKIITMDVDTDNGYANIGISVGEEILIDNIDIVSSAPQTLNFLVNFPATGTNLLSVFARSANVTLSGLRIENAPDIDSPQFLDVTAAIGLVEPNSIKYGGPTVADLDNDGDYDFILNNHNAHEFAPNVIYTNNGDGTVTRGQELSRFRLQDLHGSSAGDYDNDGDLDIALTNGGGNGSNPTPPIIYTNEGNGTYIQENADAIGIPFGGRGRSPRWVDFDLDGDLDIAFINATPLNSSETQHVFYANNGDGASPRFSRIAVPGLEDARSERVLITDLNNDHIDDVLMVGPLTVWKGNGDFSFTDMTDDWLPATSPFVGQIRNRFLNLAASHIDIDNDGDLDIYVTGGQGVFQIADRNAIDHDPVSKRLDARLSGSTGTFQIDFKTAGDLRLFELDLLGRGGFDEEYPIFLGSAKSRNIVLSLENNVFDEGNPERELNITQANANGFPTDAERAENGIYIGYLGSDEWRIETVRNGNIFFNITFSLDGVDEFVSTTPAAGNRNVQDILLRNDISTGGGLVDVSEQWNIPKGGTHTGAVSADFNNDGLQDMLIHRYAFVRNRRSDYILLNNGSSFEVTTQHDANNRGGISHGDMGQPIDYDNDGDVDIFNGDDEFGAWYMYRNDSGNTNGAYATVKVGYSPVSNVDPISAEVTITTTNGTQYKRVSSAGAVFSQSLLNIVHFGLGDASTIDNINIRWRNGEEAEFNNEAVNQLFDTDELDPTSLAISPDPIEVRVGTDTQVELVVTPSFANRDVLWASADTNVATVSQDGMVTGVTEGTTTTVTATSVGDNSVIGMATVNVVAFFPIDATSLTLDEESINIVEGNTKTVIATVLPTDADEKEVTWSSSDETVATVNQNGLITAVADGMAIITASLTSNTSINDTVSVNVTRFFAPSLAFDNRSTYENTDYVIGSTIDVTVNYHAGTGNTVIGGTNNGIRYFLRHLTSSFGLVRDFDIVSDQTAIDTESGTSTVSLNLNLEDLPANSDPILPSADLENGEFYFLFVSFGTSAGGSEQRIQAFPINVVQGNLSIADFGSFGNRNITMFPNPTSNDISFSNLEKGNYTVTVKSVLGQNLLSKTITETQSISVATLASGFYLVTLENEGARKTFSLMRE